jgi:hypothetical protein
LVFSCVAPRGGRLVRIDATVAGAFPLVLCGPAVSVAADATIVGVSFSRPAEVGRLDE